MSDTSLTVPAGVELVGPAELVYLSSSWLPGTTCLLGQLGSTAPAWALNNVTITIGANVSCNTADGLDTPANAMVCMGGIGSSVLHSTIQSVRAPERQFCHLFHASVSEVRSHWTHCLLPVPPWTLTKPVILRCICHRERLTSQSPIRTSISVWLILSVRCRVYSQSTTAHVS